MEQEVVRTLEDTGIEAKIVKRFQYNDEVVKWTDLILYHRCRRSFYQQIDKGKYRNKESFLKFLCLQRIFFELNCFVGFFINLFNTTFQNNENKTLTNEGVIFSMWELNSNLFSRRRSNNPSLLNSSKQ